MAGDRGDNIPGVKGIGPKTAKEMLLRYGSLEEIFNNLNEISKPGVVKLLEEQKDSAFLSKVLATLVNVKIPDFDIESGRTDLIPQPPKQSVSLPWATAF